MKVILLALIGLYAFSNISSKTEENIFNLDNEIIDKTSQEKVEQKNESESVEEDLG